MRGLLLAAGFMLLGGCGNQVDMVSHDFTCKGDTRINSQKQPDIVTRWDIFVKDDLDTPDSGNESATIKNGYTEEFVNVAFASKEQDIHSETVEYFGSAGTVGSEPEIRLLMTPKSKTEWEYLTEVVINGAFYQSQGICELVSRTEYKSVDGYYVAL
jgi:hypothetical protein